MEIPLNPVTMDEADKLVSSEPQESHDRYLPIRKLIPLVLGLSLNVFATSLDNTIITTAIPTIADQFHSLDDVGWYGSVYFLTTCAVTLIFGRLYTFFNVKWVYLCALLVFEIGSFLCGIAPTSTALITGRAIAGLGSGGLLTGSLLIAVNTVPPETRPLLLGIVSSVYGVASVVGPLLGGVFTDHVTWRWCFYINLPLAILPTLIILFMFKPPSPKQGIPLSQKLLDLDPIGNILFVAAVICLLLAVQWGGVKYAWKSAWIIALFVTSGVLGISFIGLQWWRGDRATLPGRIVKKRGVWGSAWFMFFMGGSYYSLQYYLPIWFQTVKDRTAVMSGVMTLSMILTVTAASILSGALVMKVGYFNPFMIVGCILGITGAGLLTTLHPDSGHSKWIGYQALLGIGVGLCIQLPFTIVQTVNKAEDIPVATAFMTFIQTLGATLALAICQNVLQVFLRANISKRVPSADASKILAAGLTNFRNFVAAQDLPNMVSAYNDAIMDIFYVAVAFSVLAIVGVLVLEWRSVRQKQSDHVIGD
ncbi:Major facilitator superfamily domain general substrate transporter [Penicillium canariense]|uniref:Major facilitator superfamily domain general substrate transporter n=1 Tax=Penicillium canariense TaxID=189055 RepID=A0A9W9IDF5_9EURO|nr:Major facilitator superfamily domain general substrate transporter [Penicillium canariense]KAJ5175584.1 Major facilitator superfamily domain general substrate transporter [Penicillium canariense]